MSFAMTGQSKPVIDRQHLSTAELKVLKAAESLKARLTMLGRTYDDSKAACHKLAALRMALLPAPDRATPTLDAAMNSEARA